MLLLVSPPHPTFYLCSTLNLNSTAVVQFKNGSYPFTLAAGLRVTCVNITTYDDKVQADPKVFSVSIGPTSSTTGGAVTVGSPSTAQVTIIDNSGKRHIPLNGDM